MDDPIPIRPATPADAQLIADYNVAMALETEHKALDPTVARLGVENAIANPAAARYFVAEIGGRLVGQLMITLEWSDWRNAFFWWVMSVYVVPEARGNGVYKALYRYVEWLAREAGACGMRLYTEKENLRAQEVYRRLGMRDSGYLVFEVDWTTSEHPGPK